MARITKPLQLGNLNLKNRLILPPMATSKAGAQGEITPAILQYYDEKTRGGYFGMVITEHAFVSTDGKANFNQISSENTCMISGLSQLSNIIHENGSPVILQLNHAGSGTTSNVIASQPVAPSAIINPSKADLELPRELSCDEIEQIVSDFANAALRAKQAGFDGVEIHSCHGYLLNQFLSPLTNNRTDEYGGNIKNRIRIHLQILRAVRDMVGNYFLILVRLGATDHMDGGISLDDSITAAKELENEGADMLDISGGMCRFTVPNSDNSAYFSKQAKAIKDAVSIPVILTGGIQSIEMAEWLLQNDISDCIGVGRPVLRDSNWAKNAIHTFDPETDNE